jgi:hypothetical protein
LQAHRTESTAKLLLTPLRRRWGVDIGEILRGGGWPPDCPEFSSSGCSCAQVASIRCGMARPAHLAREIIQISNVFASSMRLLICGLTGRFRPGSPFDSPLSKRKLAHGEPRIGPTGLSTVEGPAHHSRRRSSALSRIRLGPQSRISVRELRLCARIVQRGTIRQRSDEIAARSRTAVTIHPCCRQGARRGRRVCRGA